MKRSLITGITGFVGSHLAELLLKQGDQVFGLCRWRSKMENIEHLRDKLVLLDADLLDVNSLEAAMVEAKPDRIFHLAAQSFVPTSWLSPTATLQVNVVGQVNLLEVLRRSGLNPAIQIASSSEEYGKVLPDELPITEMNPLRPLSPYAVSKVAQDLLGFQYYQTHGLRCLRTRGFNHTGPRRGDVFVTSNFSKQIALIEKGKQEPTIHVGNLESLRDFTDVRDMVRGYILVTEKGIPGDVYNICSGKAYRIQQVLDILLSLSEVNVQVQEDPSRARPSDVPVLVGDCSKFSQLTGWKPTIPFEKTLEDLLNYWRERV